nr:hypothetical protein [Leptospira santarosai]
MNDHRSETLSCRSDQSATGLLDSVESRISHFDLSYVQESYYSMDRVWKLSETLSMDRVWKLSETLSMDRVSGSDKKLQNLI